MTLGFIARRVCEIGHTHLSAASVPLPHAPEGGTDLGDTRIDHLAASMTRHA